MTPYIPSPLIEAATGVFSILMFWMLAFGLLYLGRTFSERRKKYGGRAGWRRAIRSMYHDNKPEIALMTFVAGLWARQTTLWYFRVLEDHGWHADNFVTRNGPALVIATTFVTIVGAACWIRVILPMNNPVLAWTVMIVSAFGIGIGLALI